jgi:hypothetical protein
VVTAWQNASMIIIALLMPSCACPTPTGLGKKFSYLSSTPVEIENLNAAEPDRRIFPCRSATLPYHFDDVWTAVHKALRIQSEPIVREDEGGGVIFTDSAWHGMLGEYSNKYYIIIDEANPGETTISYQYYRYEIWFPDPNRPFDSVIRPVQTSDLMLCRCHLFEKEIIDSLPPQ